MDRITKYNLVSDSKKEFKKKFGVNPQSICIAPGRVNLIGEHTDYNLGLAMPIGINRWICAVIKKRSDQKVNVYSSNFKKFIHSDLDHLNPSELWERYILGCIKIIKDKFNINSGFDILVKGTIPIGFGVSSSAALEVSVIGTILNACNLDLDLSTILKLSNRVEHECLGIKSGMLDQYASLYSKKNNPLIIDFSTMTHSYVDSQIKHAGWILVNSMVDRELASSKYNERVRECQEGLLKINNFLSTNKKISELKFSDLQYIEDHSVLYNRLHHIISENNRVLLMKGALESGNIKDAGHILNQSHDSLSKKYEVSCKEIESIIEISKNQDGFYGGRIMGGGFGGCTINLVDINKIEFFTENVNSLFYDQYNYELKVEFVEFESGFQVA